MRIINILNNFYDLCKMYIYAKYIIVIIGLATKWLRILSIPLNDKIRNHLVANPICILLDLFPTLFTLD